MSRADEIFIQNCRDILDNGVWDTDREVRPRWPDGTPAHTIKTFGVVNRYDLIPFDETGQHPAGFKQIICYMCSFIIGGHDDR